MSSDKKVGQWGATGATGAAIGKKTLSCKKRRVPRQGPTFKNIRGQSLFKLLHTIKADGNLRIEYWVNDQD
jgi:hypothetical protein